MVDNNTPAQKKGWLFFWERGARILIAYIRLSLQYIRISLPCTQPSVGSNRVNLNSLLTRQVRVVFLLPFPWARLYVIPTRLTWRNVCWKNRWTIPRRHHGTMSWFVVFVTKNPKEMCFKVARWKLEKTMNSLVWFENTLYFSSDLQATISVNYFFYGWLDFQKGPFNKKGVKLQLAGQMVPVRIPHQFSETSPSTTFSTRHLQEFPFVLGNRSQKRTSEVQ